MKIFILGCQRSGTTLLRLILDSHSEICCYDEVESYDILEKRKISENKKKHIGFQTPGYTELFNEYQCVADLCDKDDKIIFMFREPKAVIASMKTKKNFLRVEIENNGNMWLQDKARNYKEYYNKIKPYLLTYDRNATSNGLLLPEIYQKEFDNIIYKENLIKKACAYYNYKSESYFKLKNKTYLLKYEDLIHNSLQKTNDIAQFLGVEWEESMLKHHQIEHTGIVEGIAMGGTQAKRQIDHTSLDLWKKHLSETDVEIIDSFCKATYEKLCQQPDITPC